MSLIELGILGSTLASLALIPSSSVALVIAYASSGGLVSGVAAALGIACGDLIFAILAISGLTAISETVGVFFVAIKYLAAIYLIWLGFTLIRSSKSPQFSITSRKKSNLLESFGAGLLVTLGDVKAIFFYASLFPSLVEPSQSQPKDLFAIALTVLISVGGAKILYAFLAKHLTTFADGTKFAKPAKLIAGSLMAGTGIYLIIK